MVYNIWVISEPTIKDYSWVNAIRSNPGDQLLVAWLKLGLLLGSFLLT